MTSPFIKLCHPSVHVTLCCIVSLAKYVIMPHVLCFVLVNDIMGLNLCSSLGTLVPAALFCVFYATSHQIYGRFDKNNVFCYYCDLTPQTHRQTHRTHRYQSKDTHINIYQHHLLYTHKSYLYCTKQITC